MRSKEASTRKKIPADSAVSCSKVIHDTPISCGLPENVAIQEAKIK